MASAVLGDGRVLLAGGWLTKSEQDVATVDIYDPRIYAWVDAPPLAEPRRSPSAVTLRDGRVLVVGGEDQADQKTAEIFDPVANTWKPAASSTAPHVAAPGFVLGDGRVLFFGGDYYWSSWPAGEIYDPATDSWSLTAAPHKVGGAGQAVVRLRDGRLFAVGTEFMNDGTEPAAEIYDAASNTWTIVAPPQRVGQGAGAALLPDGRVLVAGGRPGAAQPDVDRPPQLGDLRSGDGKLVTHWRHEPPAWQRHGVRHAGRRPRRGGGRGLGDDRRTVRAAALRGHLLRGDRRDL